MGADRESVVSSPILSDNSNLFFSPSSLLLLLLFFFGSVHAEEYSLADLIKLGAQKSHLAHNANDQWDQAEYDHRVSQQEFMPKWFLNSGSSMAWERTDGNDLQNRQLSVGTTVQMKTPLGTRLDVLASQGVVGGDTDQAVSTTAGVRLTQPLLKHSGWALNAVPRRQAEVQFKMSQLQYEDSLAELVDTIIMQYYLYQQSLLRQQIHQQQSEQAQQFLDKLKLQIEAGRAAPNEYLQAELELAKQQQEKIEVEREVAKQYRALLLIVGLSETEQPGIQAFSLPDYALLEEEKALELLLANNMQIQQFRTQLKTLEYQALLAKDDLRWELDLSSEFSMTGSDASFKNSTQDFLNNQDGRKLVALQLKIPLGDKLSREQTVYQNRQTLKILKRNMSYAEQQLTQNLHEYYADIAAKQQQLAFSEQAVSLAEKSWQNAKFKLESGRSSVFEVLSLQAQKAQAQLNHIQSQMALSLAYAALDRQLGKTLSRWGIRE